MRRGNITSGFEDNIVLSSTFLNKYSNDETEVISDLSPEDKINGIVGFLEEVNMNPDDFSKEDIINVIATILSAGNEKNAKDYSENIRTKFVDILGKIQGSVEYIIQNINTLDKKQIVDTLKDALAYSKEWKTSKRIASKKELTDLGFISQGTGIYKDSAHHLWQLSREGDGYSISRIAEEEAILKEKKIANKVANTITVSNDTELAPFFSNLDQNGIYYNKIAEETSDIGYSAVVDVSPEDIDDFTSVAKESGVKTAAKDVEEEVENFKVFSDEAVLTGISHYSTMGYDT